MGLSFTKTAFEKSTMDRDIFLTYRPREMTSNDSVVSLVIFRAPFDQVFPVAVGCHRALEGASFVVEGECRSPQALHDLELEKRAKMKMPPMAEQHWGMTVSEPEDATGLTLVENWWNGKVARAMQTLLPKVETLTIESVYEKQTCFRHMFRHRDAAGIERYVSVGQGFFDGGWEWTAEGPVQPWENVKRYTSRAHGKRLDRALLFEYAAVFGVDLQAALAHRRLTQSAHVAAINEWDPEEAREPTEIGQSHYEAALAAGFGEPENPEPAADRQAWAQMQQDNMRLGRKAKKAVIRAKTTDAVWEAVEDAGSLRDRDELGELWYIAVLRSALVRAYRIDPETSATRRIERALMVETAKTDWPATQAEIDKMRDDAQGDRVRLPMADRHVILEKKSTHPEELWEIVTDVTVNPPPEISDQFRQTALQQAYRAACLLDPDDPVTVKIGDLLDEEWLRAGFMTSSSHKLSMGLRDQAIKTRKRRAAAAAKRAQKKSQR